MSETGEEREVNNDRRRERETSNGKEASMELTLCSPKETEGAGLSTAGCCEQCTRFGRTQKT